MLMLLKKDNMIEKKPKVSVIIPTYNRAHLIDKSIQSVLNQTYQNFEIIIVDDASTDNTEEVVNSFASQKIIYLKHEKNKGANAARNSGIAIAKAGLLAFNDSDDKWMPTKLEKQIKIIENAEHNVGIVYTGFYQIINNNKSYIPSIYVKQKDGNIHQSLLDGNFVSTQTVLVKKECFKKLGFFDEELPRLQDWELWLRLSKCYKFKFIDEPLVIAVVQPNSITNNSNALAVALELIITKHFKNEGISPQIKSRHHLQLAKSLYFVGRKKDALTYYCEAIKLDPFNLKIFFDIFISLFGEKIYGYFIIFNRLHIFKNLKEVIK